MDQFKRLSCLLLMLVATSYFALSYNSKAASKVAEKLSQAIDNHDSWVVYDLLCSNDIDINWRHENGVGESLSYRLVCDEFTSMDVFEYLLQRKDFDPNQRSSTGLSLMQCLCKQNPYRNSRPAQFLSRYGGLLSDDQRELGINNCDLPIPPTVWTYYMNASHPDMADRDTAQRFLDYLHTKLDSERPHRLLQLPLMVAGLAVTDAGGPVSELLFRASATALEYDNSFYSTDTSNERFLLEYEGSRLFTPSPSSLEILWTDPNSLSSQSLLKQMRDVGAIVGIALNTISETRSVLLAPPIDLIVIQCLLDPTSKLEHEDVKVSAIGALAMQLSQAGVSPHTMHDQYRHWPRLSDYTSEQNSIVYTDATEACWLEYVTELASIVLNQKLSPAFEAMLKGFKLTHSGARNFDNSLGPKKIHQILVGSGTRITSQMLRDSITFHPVSAKQLNENFLQVLDEFGFEKRSEFLMAVTSSCRLPQPITKSIDVHWSEDINVTVCKTCVRSLFLPVPINPSKASIKNLLLGIIQAGDCSYNGEISESESESD